MKKSKRISIMGKKILTLATIAMILLLSSCSKDDEPGIRDISELLGTWELSRATETGDTSSADQSKAWLSINKDHTYTVNYADTYVTGKWKRLDNLVTFMPTDSVPVDIVVRVPEPNTLIMTEAGATGIQSEIVARRADASLCRLPESLMTGGWVVTEKTEKDIVKVYDNDSTAFRLSDDHTFEAYYPGNCWTGTWSMKDGRITTLSVDSITEQLRIISLRGDEARMDYTYGKGLHCELKVKRAKVEDYAVRLEDIEGNWVVTRATHDGKTMDLTPGHVVFRFRARDFVSYCFPDLKVKLGVWEANGKVIDIRPYENTEIPKAESGSLTVLCLRNGNGVFMYEDKEGSRYRLTATKQEEIPVTAEELEKFDMFELYWNNEYFWNGFYCEDGIFHWLYRYERWGNRFESLNPYRISGQYIDITDSSGTTVKKKITKTLFGERCGDIGPINVYFEEENTTDHDKDGPYNADWKHFMD